MNVLITGKNSFVGTHIRDYLNKFPMYHITELDMENPSWSDFDFHDFDAVIHVAAIVHRHQGEVPYREYIRVNAEMTYEVAKKSKEAGAGHFIFFSTLAVYGRTKSFGKMCYVNKNDEPNPKAIYGLSKWLAEKKLAPLSCENFLITVLRPPNIFGYKCKGGYITRYITLSKLLKFFPKAYENTYQGFLYIDNLTYVIKNILEKKITGIITPQDSKVNVTQLMKDIRKIDKIPMIFSGILGFFASLFPFLSLTHKVYGGVSYDDESADLGFKYNFVDFDDAMEITLKGEDTEICRKMRRKLISFSDNSVHNQA